MLHGSQQGGAAEAQLFPGSSPQQLAHPQFLQSLGQKVLPENQLMPQQLLGPLLVAPNEG